MTDPRVEAIRRHPKVGRGSCTSIDECYGDDELIEALNDSCPGYVGAPDTSTIEGAIQWALEVEGLYLEQAANARWGEDDDPELGALLAWGDAGSHVNDGGAA